MMLSAKTRNSTTDMGDLFVMSLPAARGIRCGGQQQQMPEWRRLFET